MTQQTTYFFNTINFTGKDLEKQNARAAKQEDLILSLFKANPDKLLSPSQVHTILGRKFQIYPPITSIRRAMTNLTGRLELIKTDETVQGIYNLPERTWKYAKTAELPIITTVTNTHIQASLFDVPPVETTWDSPIE